MSSMEKFISAVFIRQKERDARKRPLGLDYEQILVPQNGQIRMIGRRFPIPTPAQSPVHWIIAL